MLESLDSITQLCNEVLKNKVDNKTNEINNFKASCSSLAEQISDDKLIETKVEQLFFDPMNCIFSTILFRALKI